jgi:DNA-binding MarR family transcriptional regulator
MARELRPSDYSRLLEFRVGLRKFIRWSENEARSAGLTPAQHQLLLAIKGHNDPRGPSIGQIANYLLLQHHSVVGLADRAEEAGLIERVGDAMDHRVVRLRVTPKGERILEKLVASTLDELSRIGGQLDRLWKGIEPEPTYQSRGLRLAPAQVSRPSARRPAKRRSTRSR